MTKREQFFIFLLVFVLFVASFLFLNKGAFVAQIQYSQGRIPKISDEEVEKMSSEKDKIVIPKINLDAPLVFSKGASEEEIRPDLKNGVVYYQNTALPGQVGVGVTSGLSSGLPWEGDYRFAFSLLDKLEKGDKIYIFFQGKKFLYLVDRKETITPKELVAQRYEEESKIILTTCWPIGTCFKRILIHANLSK